MLERCFHRRDGAAQMEIYNRGLRELFEKKERVVRPEKKVSRFSTRQQKAGVLRCTSVYFGVLRCTSVYFDRPHTGAKQKKNELMTPVSQSKSQKERQGQKSDGRICSKEACQSSTLAG
jgi:hypothetical protein